MGNYVELLKLQSHIEGGYFGLFYKSTEKVQVLNKQYPDELEQSLSQNNRFAGSSIYFLLEKNAYSAWHRLKSDEVWHYYDGGSPIDIHVIDKKGNLKTHTLGNPGHTENALFQIAIKSGDWFAAEVRDKTSYGLVGCTVSPAFEYVDFELAEPYRDSLTNDYPKLADMIDKFIKPNPEKNNGKISNHKVLPGKNQLTVEDYIKMLNLERHPEGGRFCETYKATDIVTPIHSRYQLTSNKNDDKDNKLDTKIIRSAGTAIYFLLNQADFSAWHQLQSDEIWHYYDGGSPVDIHVIDNDGNLKTETLGNPLHDENASFQVLIKSGNWFAAEVRDKTSFALAGCTVSPGFEFNDFSLANKKSLSTQYPEHTEIINRLSSNKCAIV